MKPLDEAAYRDFVVARMESLRRTAYLLCRNWHTADDLVSETLVKLYRHWLRLQYVGNQDAYVRRILIRSWLDERRRPWRRETSTATVPEVSAPRAEAADTHDLLALLGRLPPKKRAVLVLRFYCDLSVEQTAEIVGCSEGTVKSQTARGLEMLRRWITTPYSQPSARDRGST